MDVSLIEHIFRWCMDWWVVATTYCRWTNVFLFKRQVQKFSFNSDFTVKDLLLPERSRALLPFTTFERQVTATPTHLHLTFLQVVDQQQHQYRSIQSCFLCVCVCDESKDTADFPRCLLSNLKETWRVGDQQICCLLRWIQFTSHLDHGRVLKMSTLMCRLFVRTLLVKL